MAEAAAGEVRRTKVLWLTKGLGPGGAERLLLSFAQNAGHDRFEFHAAYLLPWKDHLVADLEAAGVTTHCLAGARPWDLRWLWRLRKLIRSERIEVLHNHSPLVAAQARLLVRTLPRRRRPGMLTTEHNMWGSHQRLTRWLNAATIGLDDHVFAVSDQVRNSMWPKIKDRVEVLIHGVDVDAIDARRSERNGARAEHGLTDDDFVVVTVANLRANKDYPTMLRAARKLVDDGVPVTFLAVGQGPLEAELCALRDELGLSDHFRFLGYQADPVRILVAGDVFCLSSQYEGLPIALAEALAAGLPIVATDVGGVASAVTHGREGLLVEPGDAAALSKAIAALTTGTSRIRAGGYSSARAADFAISRAVRRQVEMYEADGRSARNDKRRGEPKNLLIFTPNYPSAVDPARGIFVRDHARAMQEAGLNVAVAMFRSSKAPIWPPASDSAVTSASSGIPLLQVNYRPLRPFLHYIARVHAVLRLVAALTREGRRPDIMHVHWWRPAVPVVVAGRILGIPTVITEHGSGWPREEMGWRHRLEARLTFRLASAGLPVSEWLRGKMVSQGVTGVLRVVPNIVDTRVFHPTAEGRQDQFRPSDGVPVAMIVARVRHDCRKGIGEAVEAIRLLRIDGTRCRLVVVGDGPARKDFERLAADLDVGDLVRFVGWKERCEIAEMHKGADVFISATHDFETFGVGIAEALASGLPVVATAVGAVPDLVSSAVGVLVEPRDPHQLAIGIQRTLSRNWDRAAISASVVHLAPHAIATQLLDIYEMLILRSD